MTEALALLLATCAVCCNPAHVSRSSASSTMPKAQVRVAWDPETGTWGAAPSGAPGNLDTATSLAGPALPFEAPVEFALPGGGRAVALGRAGMENVRVVRGKDGRFHPICEPAMEPSTGAPDTGPTDR